MYDINSMPQLVRAKAQAAEQVKYFEHLLGYVGQLSSGDHVSYSQSSMPLHAQVVVCSLDLTSADCGSELTPYLSVSQLAQPASVPDRKSVV